MSVIGRNMLGIMVTQLGTWLVGIVVLITVPDLLDPARFGSLNFALAYVGFFALAAGLGTATYLTREVARDHSIVGPYVFNAVVMKIATAVILSAVAIWVAIVLGNTGETLLLIAVCCIGMAFSLVNEVIASALIGMERVVRPMTWLMIQVYVQSVVGIIVLVAGGGVVAYAIVLAASSAIPMTANAVAVIPQVRGHHRLDVGIWRKLVVGGAPLLVLSTFNLIYGTIDVPILHGISGEEAVGWYSLAYRWAGTPIFIATAVVGAFFPQFSSEGATLSARFGQLVNRAVHIILLVSVPAAVGVWLVAADLIEHFYGPAYDESVVLLRILAVHVPLAAMDTVLAMALIAVNRLRKYIIVAGIAALLNPFAFWVAITITDERYDNGAIGAALVTVGTEVFIMIGALALRPRGVLDGPAARSIGRIVLASATMIPMLMVADGLPIVLKVILGTACYVAAGLLLRVVSRDDLQMVVQAVRTRGARVVDPAQHPSLEAETAAEVIADAEVAAEIAAEQRAAASTRVDDDPGLDGAGNYGDR